MIEKMHEMTRSDARQPEQPATLLDLFAEGCLNRTYIAVKYGETQLSYKQLNARSLNLAHKILALGLEPQTPVAVCLKPCVDVLVAILGIYRSGMIYVPFDPTHPPAYTKHMLDEAEPKLALVTSKTKDFEPIQHMTTWLLDQMPELRDDFVAIKADLPSVTPEMIATIFFTSGTTGKPKGVPLTHGNLFHFIESARAKYGFKSSDIFTSIARYTFSISLFDLFGPLSVGGQVWLMDRDRILAPQEFDRILSQVSVVHAGPSLLGSLFRFLKESGQLQRKYLNIRHISTGGDVVPAPIMEQMKATFPNAEVFVIYGCTEISCMGTTFPIPRSEKVTTSLVGKPFPGVGLLLVGPEDQPVGQGEVGEICFSGPGVTQGYLHREELNIGKFLQWPPLVNPSSKTSTPATYYKTGDLGRLCQDGQLEILGRKDYQIQLRGIRIELVGIENAIKESGLAENCALILHKDLADERLIAFVVDPKIPDIRGFREHLGTLLPDFMLPQHLVVLAAMPLTPNGKLDRQALQKIPWNQNAGSPPASATPPPKEDSDPITQKLTQVFERVLQRSPIGLDEDFFDLGGHSLLAVVALYEIEKTCGTVLSPQTFFKSATIRNLHTALSSQLKGPEQPVLLSQALGNQELFLLSGIQVYKPLVKHLEGLFTCYGIFSSFEMTAPETASSATSVTKLAAEYLAIIRRHKPKGPYHLLGYSFAGIVAFEVAQQLRREGDEVASLTLLDAVLPEWIFGTKFRLLQLRRIFSAPFKDLVKFSVEKLTKRVKYGSLQKPLISPRFQGDSPVAQMESKRDRINHSAAAEYLLQMKPYPDPVLLVVSGERLRNDPLKSRSCGWQTYTPQLVTKSVSGDHYAMMEGETDLVKIKDMLEDITHKRR